MYIPEIKYVVVFFLRKNIYIKVTIQNLPTKTFNHIQKAIDDKLTQFCFVNYCYWRLILII